ncbi:IS3 family transposase [Paenibacillus paridis]|uniref:IS3 family transposase n=1 Tax=Paenibacillus paridis TaxID=2583376 RepID=UPI00111E29DC|nr:IS3 family transposase [Paenibacillus paridis]
MAKKGQTFKQYTEEFKLAAVQEYMKGSSNYKKVAEKFEIGNYSQLFWVKKWQKGEAFDVRADKIPDPLTGRPRTIFSTEIKEYMMAIHFTHPYFGYPRMRIALQEAGYIVNHKKEWRLMKALSIQSVIRRKRRQSNYTFSVV